MKNREKLPEEYRQLKTKVFTRAFAMVVAAIGIIWLLYRLVFYNNFANWMVILFQRVFGMEYSAALHVYARVFRLNKDIILFAGAVLLFFVLFRIIYLNWFSKYFVEINRGIDALIKEDAGEVALSAELVATERKINTIKRTLEERKRDTQFAEQQKSDLIVYLAHDLKTPLTTVIGYLTLLRDEPEMSIELRAKYTDIALGKAERLEALINEFFDITRFSLTQMTLEMKTINLTRMLEQIAYEFRPMLSEKGLALDMQLMPGVKVTCDTEKLERVFDNLFRNAISYSYAGKSIDVSLAVEDGKAVVRIRNQSETIPPEKLQRIFDQFYRLDSARSTTTGGAGLGLAIAKEIVVLHGGTICAQSEEEHILFTVTLPGVRQETA